MKKSLIEAKKMFNSILCLAVEGREFYKTRDLLNTIRGEAVQGFEICKNALQPADSLGRATQCLNCGGFYTNDTSICPQCNNIATPGN